MKRKDNYVMMKRATPKQVTLPDGRTFVARYERVPRSRLPPYIKIRRRYRGAPVRQGGWRMVSFIKRLLPFGKKADKKVITSSAAKKLAKIFSNKALDKAPDVIDSLSNRTNNKAIKKVLNANITKAAVNKGTRILRRIIKNWDML